MFQVPTTSISEKLERAKKIKQLRELFAKFSEVLLNVSRNTYDVNFQVLLNVVDAFENGKTVAEQISKLSIQVSNIPKGRRPLDLKVVGTKRKNVVDAQEIKIVNTRQSKRKKCETETTQQRVTFADLNDINKKELMLKWVFPNLLANEVVNKTLMKSVGKIKLPDSFLNEQVDIFLIKEFFDDSAFKIFQNLVSERRKIQKYTCGICKNQIKKRDHSILRELCLIWSHVKCTQLKEVPEESWFCSGC